MEREQSKQERCRRGCVPTAADTCMEDIKDTTAALKADGTVSAEVKESRDSAKKANHGDCQVRCNAALVQGEMCRHG